LAPFDFVQQAIQRQQIVLHSDGSPVRNYLSLARWGETVLAATRGERSAVTHVTGQAWSMYQLAKLAADAVEVVTGKPINVMLGEQRPAEAPYDFCSNYWSREEDDRQQKMYHFLTDTAHHLLRGSV
jgi:hypothetical protein